MKPEHMKYIAIICIVGFIGAGASVMSLTGTPNPVGDTILSWFGIIVIPPPPPGDTALVTGTVVKRGEESTFPSATVYIWHDANGDGIVQLGDLSAGIGEIETCSTSSGVFTSGQFYPIGDQLGLQLHATGYEVKTYWKDVPSPGSADWNKATALPLGQLPMIHQDTSITVSLSAVGTAGTVALVTDTGDYNYTTNGATPTVTVRISCATDDYGFGQETYTHWVTGYSYHQSFMALKFVLTEKSNVIFGSYDYIGDDGTSQWLVWDLDTIFNDASLDTDGFAEISFALTCVGDFDFDEINVYSEVRDTHFGQYSFGSADGQETDIDFVA